MPKKSNQSRGKKKSNKRQTHLAPGAQNYNGPYRVARHNLQEECIEAELVLEVNNSSSVGGAINTVFAMNLSSFAEYAQFVGIYDEFRLLACQLFFYPNAEDAVIAATSYAPQAIVLDRDANTALTSYAQAADFESCKITAINKRSVQSYKMSGSEDSGFITNPATVPAWFKVWSTGLTASTIYGIWIMRGLWQFRGRV